MHMLRNKQAEVNQVMNYLNNKKKLFFPSLVGISNLFANVYVQYTDTIHSRMVTTLFSVVVGLQAASSVCRGTLAYHTGDLATLPDSAMR